MAITSSYPLATPSMKDNLVGTKFIENKEPVTKSFNIGDIAELIGANIGPGGIISYGQLSRITNSTIAFGAINTWQPLGVVGTLSSVGSGFSLGTTDKFALKNISGSAKTMNISASLSLSYTLFNYYPIFDFCLAINGVLIDESIVNRPVYTEDQTGFTIDINWLVPMPNNAEVSIYIKTNYISSQQPVTFKIGRLVATQI